MPELEDLFESEYIGPSKVLLLGIVGNGDKNLRVTSWGANVLLFRDNFSESDLLDFSTKKICQEPTGCYIKDGEGSVQLIETHEFRHNTRYQGEQIGMNVKNNSVIVNEIVVRNFSVYVRRGVWDTVDYEKHNS